MLVLWNIVEPLRILIKCQFFNRGSAKNKDDPSGRVLGMARLKVMHSESSSYLKDTLDNSIACLSMQ